MAVQVVDLGGVDHGERPSVSAEYMQSGVTSGRLLEDLSQFGSTMVRALPAISAIGGLWGTRCGRWPTLAALTCAM